MDACGVESRMIVKAGICADVSGGCAPWRPLGPHPRPTVARRPRRSQAARARRQKVAIVAVFTSCRLTGCLMAGATAEGGWRRAGMARLHGQFLSSVDACVFA